MSGYVFHPAAYDDLDGIWDYIATNSMDAADRVRDEIRDAMRALVLFPQRGHRRPDLTSRPLRFIAVYDYPVAYAPHLEPLAVLAVLHGRRSPRTIAALLRRRQ